MSSKKGMTFTFYLCLLFVMGFLLPNGETIKSLKWKKPENYPHAEGQKKTPMKPLDLPVDLPEHYRNMEAEKYFASKDPEVLSRSETVGVGPDSVQNGNDDICLMPSCVNSASKFLENMESENVSPCEDFYNFACQKKIRRAIIPEGSLGWSYFGDVDERVHHEVRMLLQKPINPLLPTDMNIKMFYQSCMNEEKMDDLELEPLMNFMDRLEVTVPLLNRYRTVNMESPAHTTESIMSNLMADTGLFGIDLSVDYEHAKGPYTLMIYQPTLFLDKKVYLERTEKHDKLLSAYKLYIGEIISRLHLYFTRTRGQFTEEEMINIAVNKMVGLESALASILHTRDDVDMTSKAFMTFKKLKTLLGHEKTDKVNIADIFANSILKLANYKVTDETVVHVPDVTFFKNIARVIQQTPDDDLINYLVIREIVNLIPSTTSAMRTLSKLFDKLTGRAKSSPPRWKTCVSTVSSYFGPKVSQMYVDAHADSIARNATLKMTKNLAEVIHGMIQKTDWMDESTKAHAVEKLEAIDIVAGYNDKPDIATIEKVFDKLEILKPDAYLENLLKLKTFWASNTLNRINDNHTHFVEIEDKDYDTTLVNAMYTPLQNTIYIPFGIQKPPFFRENTPLSLLYGSLGAIIAHEISHGFDNMGSQFDKDGNLKNWWSKESKQKYESRLDCFVKQYSEYSYDLGGLSELLSWLTVDGNMTLGENVADNTGLKAAYKAYKKHMKDLNIEKEPSLPGLSEFSSDQLFFLAYANIWCESSTLLGLIIQLKTNPHPPGKNRVIGTLSNMKEFQNAFQCKSGNAMVSPKRCKIF